MFLETMALMDKIPTDFLTGGILGTLFGALLVVGILLSIVFYFYHALAWQAIARKLKYKNPWLAWIPFANIAMILQLGKIKWGWIFLVLVPIFGWIALYVLYIIATWRIFEIRKYPGWFSLSVLIPKVGGILYLIAIGFVAWKNKN
jgi:hypothetical protein